MNDILVAERADSSTLPEPTPSTLVPCQEAADADLWFAEQPAGVELAKSLCHTCPVRELCLASALERGEPWGVWGGEVFVDGKVVPTKRGRGRPRKHSAA